MVLPEGVYGPEIEPLSLGSLVVTSVGVVSSRPDVSSRRTERPVGRVGLSSVPSEVRRMDLRASLGFSRICEEAPCRISDGEGCVRDG